MSDIKQRIFDRCIEMGGPLDTECLIWTGYKDRDGYGTIRYQGKQWRVHRLVFELCCGPIPKGMQVNHECYQPDCSNPLHLVLGDQKSNMKDMIRHGRSLAGESNNFATTKREQVVEILRLVNEGKQFTHVSRRLGVSVSAIAKIAYGQNWKDVPGPRLTPPPPRPEKRFFGVSYDKAREKWHAFLILDGKKKHLGLFPYELLAACCVNAHIAWLGLNKPLNVIDPDEWKAAGIYD